MPKYWYSALDQEGREIADFKVVANYDELLKSLISKNLFLQDVKLVEKQNETTTIKFFKVSNKIIYIFTWQLSVMLKSGSTLPESLKMISNKISDRNFQNVLKNILNSLENGKSLSDSLSNYKNIFPETYISVIKAGESSGILPRVLEELADYLEKKEYMKNKIRTLLTYPIILLIISTVGICFLLGFVIPKFLIVFQSMGNAIPISTKIIFMISSIFKNYALPIFFISSILLFLLYLILKIFKKENFYHKLILYIPFLKDLIIKINIKQFTLTLKLLLESGIPLLNALEMSINTLTNKSFSNKLYSIIPLVEKGDLLSSALKTIPDFPDIITHMIYIGENSGSLNEMLNKIEDFYTKEIEMSVSEFMSILEPLILLILGGIVCLIAIAIFLPITDLVNSISRR